MGILLPYARNPIKPFIVAAANGQPETLEFMLESHDSKCALYVDRALQAAAQNGHVEAMELLLGFCSQHAVKAALEIAVTVRPSDNMIAVLVQLPRKIRYCI